MSLTNPAAPALRTQDRNRYTWFAVNPNAIDEPDQPAVGALRVGRLVP